MTANAAPPMIAEPDAANVVIDWASGSTAETVKDRSEPSFTETLAGAVTTGARSVFAIVMTVVAVRIQAFPSFAVQVTVVEPELVKVGVPLTVMLGFRAVIGEVVLVR